MTAGIIAFLHENAGLTSSCRAMLPSPRDRPLRRQHRHRHLEARDQVIITDFGVNLRGAAFYEDRYLKIGAAGRSPTPGTPARSRRCIRPPRSTAYTSRWANSADPENQPECRHAAKAEQDLRPAITTPASTTAMICGRSSPRGELITAEVPVRRSPRMRPGDVLQCPLDLIGERDPSPATCAKHG